MGCGRRFKLAYAAAGAAVVLLLLLVVDRRQLRRAWPLSASASASAHRFEYYVPRDAARPFDPAAAPAAAPLPRTTATATANQTATLGERRQLLAAREADFRAVSDVCRGLFRADKAAQREAAQFTLSARNANAKATARARSLAEELRGDCRRFLRRRSYWETAPTEEERRFPLAFSLLVYTDAAQVESLLRAIYAPHNVYCVHVDAKAPALMHEAMAGLARCLGNVHVVPGPMRVQWGNVSLVYAELMCARLLLQTATRWRYYINLTGQEFPLWPNRHLVRILKAFRGANDITASTRNVFEERFRFSWRVGRNTHVRKRPAPGNLTVLRGTAHAVARREFVEAAVNAPLAVDFLDWLGDTFVPDEMFLPTLNHNAATFPVPGGNPENVRRQNPVLRGTVARFKQWFRTEAQARRGGCRGLLQRSICVQGSADLRKLRRARQLFVNKVLAERDPIGFKCLEFLHHTRSLAAYAEKEPFEFDTDFYEELPFVRTHLP